MKSKKSEIFRKFETKFQTKLITLLIVVMLVTVLFVGCSRQDLAEDSSIDADDGQDSSEAEDLSEYEQDLVGEDEVDIGEII
tara:strand:- start:9649 stop:9894 length:246 start_codon:yes stop_codon:yes gene_type:complete